MKRKEIPFPKHEMLEALEPTMPNVIAQCWKSGVFDDYAEEHFLIRAIEKDTDYFKWFSLQYNYALDSVSFPENFLINLNTRLYGLCKIFDKEEIYGFLRNQFSAGKRNYSLNTFLEALSEIHFLFFFCAFGPKSLKLASYEPQLGCNGANPEARFEYDDGTVLDIEVKTPCFPKRDFGENIVLPGVLLNKEGRKELSAFCQDNEIHCRLPNINKFKEYLVSAEKKFVIPNSGKHINLLVINWSYAEFSETGLFEPVQLLCNPFNGLLVKKDIALQLGISENVLKKVTAILVYTQPVDMLSFSDIRYLFRDRSYKIIMNPFAEFCDANTLYSLTQMSINWPSDFSKLPGAYFNLDPLVFSEQKTNHINTIIGNHLM